MTSQFEIELEWVASAVRSVQLALSQNLDSVQGSKVQEPDAQLRDATLSL
jgi:hypothetical protein